MKIYTPELVQGNATFAVGGAFKGLPFPTNPALRVIGCVDSRVDPSDVLGLKLGEAVVMRNIGGRVAPEALRSWSLLGRLGAEQPSSDPQSWILEPETVRSRNNSGSKRSGIDDETVAFAHLVFASGSIVPLAVSSTVRANVRSSGHQHVPSETEHRRQHRHHSKHHAEHCSPLPSGSPALCLVRLGR